MVRNRYDMLNYYGCKSYAELCVKGVTGQLEEEDYDCLLAQSMGQCDFVGCYTQIVDRLERLCQKLES